MQNSGSKLESARVDKNCKPSGNLSQQNESHEKGALKVDYLTPLCNISAPEVFVYKEKRRLYVVQSNVLVRDYPVGLGFHPQGDKEKEGDGRTPEGEFWICVKNAASQFGKSLGLNYPDKKHAERAFFAGIISPVEFRDILLAFENRDKPPWNTVLGGEIFIHSGGAHKDWTNGCVALYDSDMEELFKIAAVGTPVSIRP
ncbi:MAG: L,D-transpeptidase [Deltaproteobacteria bacterium]|nr:L,D-transpeptidase [Deltaproteobacteria bacterium]